MKTKPSGFTLIEIAIVMVIIGLMVGSLLEPLAAQRNRNKTEEARKQITTIYESLLGFAAAQGRLPCPTVPNNNGLESGGGATNCQTAGGAPLQHGFIPANTLGLTGKFNNESLLIDPWNNPIRFSITNHDRDNDGAWDFVRTDEIRTIGMDTLLTAGGSGNPLVICDDSSAGLPSIACDAGDNTLSSATPAVIFSMGSDWAQYSSNDQIENAGEGGTQLGGYNIALDSVFVSTGHRIRSGDEYNDIVTWVSPNTLYAKLLQSGKLP